MRDLDASYLALEPHYEDGLAQVLKEGLARRLVCLTLEATDADPMTNAPVYRRAEIVGLVTSGGHGHTIGRAIALAYVETGALGSGRRAGDRGAGRTAPGEAFARRPP